MGKKKAPIRKPTTIYEIRLWGALRQKQYEWGVKIWRQTRVTGHILAFYFPDLYLGVQLDGEKSEDVHRDAQVLHNGVRIIRFPNPAQQDEINEIVSEIYAEVCNRTEQAKHDFPQNRRASYSSQGVGSGSNFPNKQRTKETDGNNERCGKLENPLNDMTAVKLASGNRFGKPVRPVDKNFMAGKACGRQVYASMEVAENMAKNLHNMGILTEVEKCKKCGLIHIKELR